MFSEPRELMAAIELSTFSNDTLSQSLIGNFLLVLKIEISQTGETRQ